MLSAVLYNGGHEPVFAGHKGLFFDNLDEHFALQGGEGLGATPIWLSLSELILGAREHRLVPWADPVYHVRNRAMMPRHGRWLQRDPNASGVVVHGMLAYHGGRIGAGADGFDLSSLYRDGFSLQQYVGSNGWRNSDPLGLFWADAAASAVMVGVRGLRGGLENMISEYSSNMEYDLDWAIDWSAGDDWHSRGDNSWVSESFSDGFWGGIEEGLWDAVDPWGIRNWGGGDDGPAMAGMNGLLKGPGKAWRAGARAANRTGKVAHHVISWYKTTAKRFAALQRKYGFTFDLQSVKNMLPLDKAAHGAGRHRNVYHDRVFRVLERKLEAAKNAQKDTLAAVHDALDEIKRSILADPDGWFRPE